MVSRLQRKVALRRKLQVLRSLNSSSSLKRSSLVIDAFLYIYKLNLKLKAIEREYAHLLAIKRQYLNLINHIQKVTVEKIGERFLVKVTCEKGRDRLVSILEAFERMGVNILRARVSSNIYFSMEAIVVAQGQALNVENVTQLLLKAIETHNGSQAIN